MREIPNPPLTPLRSKNSPGRVRDPRRLVPGDADRTAEGVRMVLPGQADYTWAVAFAPDGKHLAAGDYAFLKIGQVR